MNDAVRLSNMLAEAVERASASVARVDARGRLAASGVVWADGIVVAADHTIERDDAIVVTLPDGTETIGAIAGRDHGSDLAVLRVEGAAGSLPRSGESRVGDIALALGRPFGEGVAASFGIVGAIGGMWRSRGGGTVAGFIRPDLTMYPGFSGGPLINVEGALIGVNSSRLTGGALTIPAAAAQTIVDQLLAHGRLRRGYLGCASQPVVLPPGVAATAGQETGLLIVGVEADSPAGASGLMIGDILIGIGDKPIRDTDDLTGALAAERVGQTTTLRVLRGGEARDLQVTIGER